MNEFLSKFAEAVLLAAVPVVVPLVVGWLVSQVQIARARLASELPDLYWVLNNAAKLAVDAAEQAGIAKLITDKKRYAIEVAELYLAEKGIDIDIELIDAAIEAAVLNEFGEKSE